MLKTTLMDPTHLDMEINDLELMAAQMREEAARVHADVERIIDYVRDTYNAGEPTLLSNEEVKDLIVTLSNIDMYREGRMHDAQFTLRAYVNLRLDRRWKIGSKLKFLK